MLAAAQAGREQTLPKQALIEQLEPECRAVAEQLRATVRAIRNAKPKREPGGGGGARAKAATAAAHGGELAAAAAALGGAGGGAEGGAGAAALLGDGASAEPHDM
jgi:hypothetical protein